MYFRAKVFQAVAKLGVNMSKNMIGKQMKKLGAVHHKKQSKYMHVQFKDTEVDSSYPQ